MSTPDYAQRLSDHQSFLVLVKPLGRRIGASDYGKIYDRIRNVQQVCIPSDPRTMMVRYKHEYQPEDNEWGDFQFHRRVLGLLCIVQYHAENPLSEIEAHYNSIKSLYGSSLFDSRLILLGVANVDDLSDVVPVGGSFSGELLMKADHFGRSDDLSASDIVEPDAAYRLESNDAVATVAGPSAAASANNDAAPLIGGLRAPSSSGPRHRKPLSDVTAKQLLCYESAEACLECVTDDIRDFACSLFYILESKRISASKLQVERQPQLLMAPYERRDIVHLDMESKIFKKRYIGRQKKHLGDLCLLAALYSEAGSNYSMALDILKSADDYLWMAGALEGLCCAAFYVNYPSPPDKSPLLPRNRSFSTKRGATNLFQNFSIKPTNTSSSVMESFGLDLAGPKLKNIFVAEEIGERYREAIQQYSKFRPAAIVLELEACIKASRILILQGKRWEVCEFLQRVACVSLDFCNEEKVARWNALADLYAEITFLRKAAFFKRLAAIECVLSCLASAVPTGSTSVPPPRAVWQQCRSMLLQSFPGYKLSLCLKDYDSPAMVGWPALRHRVFAELVQAALEVGDSRAAVEYSGTAMHVLFDSLLPNQLTEISVLIEEQATAMAEESRAAADSIANATAVAGLSVPASTAAACAGRLSPAVAQPLCFAFTKIPLLNEVKVEKLPPHLVPIRRPDEQSPSVFIYTPLEKGTARRRQRKGPLSTDLTWVEGDFSEVELYMYNPMPYELKLTNIGLITEGVSFESHPSGHSLPADSGPHLIKVVGTPKCSGTLVIKGYTCNLLGIVSSCLFADLPKFKETGEGSYSVEVSPSLPRLHVSECGGLPRSPYLVTGGNSELHTSAVLRLLFGERKECAFRLRNVGSSESVESVELVLENKHRAAASDGGHRLLQWDVADLASQLPVAPGEEAVLTIIADAACIDPTDVASWSAVPLCPPQQQSQAQHQRYERHQSGGPKERADSRSSSSLLECTLKIKYSGGRGAEARYYRQCALAIDVVLDPSLDILSKQILSTSSEEFKLILEVVNRSNMTLDLHLPAAVSQPLSPPTASTVLCLRPMDTTSISLVGTKADFFATDTEVERYLASLLQIKWTSSTAEGSLPSVHLRWSADELAAARRPAVLLDVGFTAKCRAAPSIGFAAAAAESEIPHLDVGTAVDVFVELRNHCSRTLKDVTIKMDVLVGIAMRSGSNPPSAIDCGFCTLLEQSIVRVKECDMGAQHAAVKTLVAFYPGRYVLLATCTDSDNIVLSRHSVVDFTVD